jgi:hypothetical protein
MFAIKYKKITSVNKRIKKTNKQNRFCTGIATGCARGKTGEDGNT